MSSRWEGIDEFVAVAESGQFTTAAERLGVSSSHISRQIARLEERLQTRLLYRSTRRVTLSEAGQTFLQHCQRLQDGREEALRAMGDLASEHFGAQGKPGDSGYFADLMMRILHRDSGHLFATVFFLMALGYWAAFFYLANRWLMNCSSMPGQRAATTVDAAMFWLPSRLLILVMALAGDFRRVMDAVDGRMLQLEDNHQVLEDATIAALDLGEAPDQDDLPAGVDMLEALQSLLLRCLALWLILAAIWIMLV